MDQGKTSKPEDKPRAKRIVVGFILGYAALAISTGLFLPRLVNGDDLIPTALCPIVPILFFAPLTMPAVSGVQLVVLTGSMLTIYKLSAKLHAKWPVRLLLMAITWVLMTTLTNIHYITVVHAFFDAFAHR